MESAQSWKELLLALKRRGLSMGPELAVRRCCRRSASRVNPIIECASAVELAVVAKCCLMAIPRSEFQPDCRCRSGFFRLVIPALSEFSPGGRPAFRL